VTAGAAEGATANDWFVGRRALLTSVLQDLEGPDIGRIDHVSGMLGAGKSAFLRRLSGAIGPGVRTATLDLSTFESSRGGESRSVAAVQADFQSLCDIAQKLLDQIRHDALGKLADEVRLARNSVAEARAPRLPKLHVEQKMSVGTDAKLDHSPQSIAVNLSPGELADHWRKAAIRVTNAVVDLITDRSDGSDGSDGSDQRTLLITVDNFDQCAQTELGTWLLDLLRGLRHTVIVLAGDAGVPPPAGAGRTLPMPNFTVDEVAEYLTLRLGRPADLDVAKRVHAYSGGRPAAVELVYEVVFDDASGDLVDISAKLSDLPTEPSERVALLVQQTLARLSERRLTTVMEAACIPRQFGTPLLSVLLEPGRDDVPAALQELEAYSFMERLSEPDSPALVVRVHPYVRDGVTQRMRLYEPVRYRDLHRRAADYFRDLVLDDSDEEAGYGSWFQYEEPTWRHNLQEWLYHRAVVGDDREFRVQFVRVFMDCLWWWANYVPLDFSGELTRDLRWVARRTGSDRLAELADALDLVLENYPVRSIKPAGANWLAVRRALLRVQDSCELADENRVRSREQRHVAALIHVFLAHAWRYPSPSRPNAMRSYDQALRLFQQNEDLWNEAWVRFEQADLLYEQGHVVRALTGSADAAVAVYAAYDSDKDSEHPYLDDELVANIHRLRGDCHLFLGDEARAATEYGLAVLHAYTFHNTGGPPDEYTHQFYIEIRGRALTPALRLHAAGREDDSVRFCEAMRAVMEPYWESPEADLAAELRSGGVVELALKLFPRGPDFSELGSKTSDFMDEWRDIHDAFDSRVARDLMAPDGFTS
jgi:tetratricopeptide (TPR) repeat protein